MKSILNARSLLLVLFFATPIFADQLVHLELVPDGAAEKVGGSYYVTCKLTEVKPPIVKKVPDGLSDRIMYGVLKFVGPSPREVGLIIDSPEGKPSRLFVDSNGNGDLTDDPATDWVSGPDYKGKLPGLNPPMLANVGSASVTLGSSEKPFDVRLGFWQYNTEKLTKQTPQQREDLRHDLKYFRCYYTAGKINVDDKTHDAILLDDLASGNFTPASDGAMVRLFIDLNDDGKLDAGEMFDCKKTMKISGKSYEVSNISADGTSFNFGPSTRPAYGPDDVAVGKIVPAFEAADLSGKTVKFPGDYKGKIVLLDFWATWCVPCMAEVPNLVAAHQKFAGKGFEVLGVTLDQPGDGQKVAHATSDHKMTWPQLFGDAGRSRTIADMYSVNAIPSAFLVDGTTGKILAAGNELRGDGLEKVLEKFTQGSATQP